MGVDASAPKVSTEELLAHIQAMHRELERRGTLPPARPTASQERERDFGRLLDGSLNEIYIFSADTFEWLYVNRSALVNLGYTMDELRAMPPFALMPDISPDDFQALTEPLRTRAADSVTITTLHRRKDGSRYPADIRLQLSTFQCRDAFVAMALDISERSRTEQALRESNRTLQMLIAASPLPIVSVDVEARVTGWNPAATTLFGWTAEEVLGRELPYVPAGEEADADALFQQGLAGSITGPVHIRRCRKDGTLLNLRLWPTFIRDGEGCLLLAFALYEDVTEHTRAEAALRESEQRYLSLYEDNPSMYFTLCPTGRILSVNRFGAEHLGYRRDELLGASVLLMFDPADHQTVLNQLRICTEHPLQTFAWEIGKIRKNGSRLWVKERARSIVDDQGRITILIVCEDMTDRKQAEAVLQESERRLRLIVDNEPECVKIVGTDGLLQTMNPAGLAMVEAESEEEVRNRAVLSLIHPDDRPAYQRFHESVCFGQTATLTFRVQGLRGGERLVDSHAVPLRNPDGTVTAVLSVTRDMTERKLAEDALRASEARLQRFVAEAPIGLVILDNQRRLLSANKAFCTLTGYGEEDLIGRTYDLYTHPDDLPRNLTLTEAFYRGEQPQYTLEKRYVRKSGDTIWVSVKATHIELPNHPGPLLLAVVQDVTERRRAAEERERFSQDLHDNILQSLYAVGMQLEASKLTFSKAPRKSKSYTTQAIDHLNRLVGDVRQFIALLRQETSTTLDFGQALRHLTASFSPAGETAPELDIKDAVIAMITSEQGEQLLNIAREALSNSIRHARATHRWVRLSRVDGAIRMQICDDGIGFDPKTKRKPGHGLANMAARAKRIHARFSLDSKPRHGTCITIDLPLEAPHEDAEIETDPSPDRR